MNSYKEQEEKTKESYNNYSPYNEDKWHECVGLTIQEFLHNYLDEIDLTNKVILNAGSGGECYNIQKDMIHLDLVENNIKNFPFHIQASITNIPLYNDSVDIIICVGSVINYTNAEIAISEFNRILKKNGILILEFERSDSADLLFNKKHHQDKVNMTYFYQNNEHFLTLYSEKYILNLIKNNSFSILRKKRFHTLSSFFVRLGLSENKAAKYIKFDKIFYPFSNQLAHNVIMIAKKN